MSTLEALTVSPRMIEHPELGLLHVVTINPAGSPPDPSELPSDTVWQSFMIDERRDLFDERNLVFNSLRGRSTTPDGLGLAVAVAQETGRLTDYVERPGTGMSTLPVDAGLRKSHARYGFIEVRDVVAEALLQDETFARASRLHLAGFSLGGYAAGLFSEVIGSRAASLHTYDGVGNSEVNKYAGSFRYLLYRAIEKVANETSLKMTVAEAFAEQSEIFAKYLKNAGAPEPPVLSGAAKKLERKEIGIPTNGEARRAVIRTMRTSAASKQSFEWKGSFSTARLLTDSKYVSDTNNDLIEFDRDFPRDQATGMHPYARYGFLQGKKLGSFWHDTAGRPENVRLMNRLPTNLMFQRLRYR